MKRDASVRHLRWIGFECQEKAGLFQDKRLVHFASLPLATFPLSAAC